MSESIYKDDISQYMKKLRDLVPELNDSWMGYHNEVFKDGAISNMDKQLIALACAHITGCPYCIRARTKSSKAQGATGTNRGSCLHCYEIGYGPTLCFWKHCF